MAHMAYSWPLKRLHGDALGPQASPWTYMPLRVGFREVTYRSQRGFHYYFRVMAHQKQV